MVMSNLQLKIKKRTQPEWLIFFIVIMPFLFSTLCELLPLPRFIRYSLDFAWIFLLILGIINLVKKNVIFLNKINVIKYWIGAFVLTSVMAYVFSYQSVIYFLWGFRNNFRFFFFFLCVILFLDFDDGEKLLKLFDAIFWINTVVMLFQYFALHYKQDYLGGVFGVEKGCNGYINIFFVIIVTKSVLSFLNKKENIWMFLSKSAVSLLLATLAEIKFFYIEYIFILFVAFLITNFSVRKLISVFIAILLLFVSVSLLYRLFPFFNNFFNIENIITSQSEGGYSSVDDLNRLTAVPTVANRFLETPFEKIFGLGLGNCDGSTNFEFVNTPFYLSYKYLKFLWFSAPFITLETGFLGLTLYIGFFILIFVLTLSYAKSYGNEKSVFQLAGIVALVCPLIIVYNSSLRTEAGYMIFFVLALPFVLLNKSR